jgi:uncharacterized membrane protein YeaQ/YmgE (transglycosylase-associated protein family)
MSDLLVFATIGLLAGAAARLWYPGREPMQVLGTMLVGTLGAVPAGMISWAMWPAVDGQLYPAALLMSFVGAVAVLAVWAGVAYGRRITVPGNRAR